MELDYDEDEEMPDLVPININVKIPVTILTGENRTPKLLFVSYVHH
jgi:hypothetical protein